MPCKNNPIDDWLENIECMYEISESRGIKFFSFMQPMLFTKKSWMIIVRQYCRQCCFMVIINVL